MDKIVILGISGSIGRQALELVDTYKDRFELVGASTLDDAKFLQNVVDTHIKCNTVCINKGKVTAFCVLSGQEGLEKLASLEDADIIVNAISGIDGLAPLLASIRAEKTIAIANKESLVSGYELISKELKKHPNASLIPVDSEHSAIFQCLIGEKMDDIKNLIITASGGAFRDYSKEQLENVTVEQALNHPTWKMGPKITVDCATLVNKGLEIIEAHNLFGIDYDHIIPVLHYESIVHSLVEYKDGSIKALMAIPDMKLPILFALGKTERISTDLNLNLYDKSLTFKKVDLAKYKAISLAYKVGKQGKTMPAVYSAADEVLVQAFIDGKIKFTQIVDLLEKVCNHFKPQEIHCIDCLFNAINEAKEYTNMLIEGGH